MNESSSDDNFQIGIGFKGQIDLIDTHSDQESSVYVPRECRKSLDVKDTLNIKDTVIKQGKSNLDNSNAFKKLQKLKSDLQDALQKIEMKKIMIKDKSIIILIEKIIRKLEYEDHF